MPAYEELAAPGHALPAGYAGRAFRLNGYQENQMMAELMLAETAVITVTYARADVAGLAENLLTVQFWDGGGWSWGGVTCERDEQVELSELPRAGCAHGGVCAGGGADHRFPAGDYQRYGRVRPFSDHHRHYPGGQPVRRRLPDDRLYAGHHAHPRPLFLQHGAAGAGGRAGDGAVVCVCVWRGAVRSAVMGW